MARYLSKSQSYRKTVRQPLPTLVQGPAGPEMKVLPGNEQIMAEWLQGGLTAYERSLAQERFNFLGVSEGEDPLRRVSILDTDILAADAGWSEETKAEIEAELDEGQNEFYFRVEEQRLEAPWPAYDQQSAKEILEALPHTGVHPEYVLAYERENRKREAVIGPLETMVPVEEETELLTA